MEKEKAILVLVDGMRPDGLTSCGSDYVGTLLKESRYTLAARTVMPSVTLPCHMSLFHGVPPERHNVLTNTFIPPVRPIDGLCERLTAAGKQCAFFYDWAELRDLTRPDSLAYAQMFNLHRTENPDDKVAAAAESVLRREKIDFAFVYLGETDAAGHDSGWMTEPYFDRVRNAVRLIRHMIETLGDKYTIVITADHGGHARMHGTDCDEDMTIPLLLRGKRFPAGEMAAPASILDIAPTIAALLGAQPAPEWEGKSLL